MKRYAGNCDYRRAIRMRFIQAVQKMNGAGTRRANADANPARALGEPRSSERRGFLMAHAAVLDPTLTFAQGFDNGVDAAPTTPKQWVAPHEIRV
jgi:hypothetical protein